MSDFIESVAEMRDGYRNERRELIARIETLEKALEWQPIETAPKDKSILLANASNGYMVCGAWATSIDTGESAWRIGSSWEDDEHVCLILKEGVATHWMPLPEPPTEATKGDAVDV